MDNREFSSAENRGFPAVTELRNRIAGIENLVKSFAAQGRPFPVGLRTKLTELQNLRSSLFRIEARIASCEREKTFITPVRTENKKRSLIG